MRKYLVTNCNGWYLAGPKVSSDASYQYQQTMFDFGSFSRCSNICSTTCSWAYRICCGCDFVSVEGGISGVGPGWWVFSDWRVKVFLSWTVLCLGCLLSLIQDGGYARFGTCVAQSIEIVFEIQSLLIINLCCPTAVIWNSPVVLDNNLEFVSLASLSTSVFEIKSQTN